MSLFDSLGRGDAPQQAQNPQNALNRLRGNPAGMLKEAGYTIPQGMTDPRQIINHLLQSGQVNSPRLQMAQQIMSRMGHR